MKYELQSIGLFEPKHKWHAEAPARDSLSEAKQDMKTLIDREAQEGWDITASRYSNFVTLSKGYNAYSVSIVAVLEGNADEN